VWKYLREKLNKTHTHTHTHTNLIEYISRRNSNTTMKAKTTIIIIAQQVHAYGRYSVRGIYRHTRDVCGNETPFNRKNGIRAETLTYLFLET